MKTTHLNAVRQSCQFVVGHAKHVAIDDDKLKEVASTLPIDEPALPRWDEQQHFVGPKSEMAAFVVQSSAINFGLSSHSALKSPNGLSPYRFAMQRLTERFEQHGPLSLEELSRASAQGCAVLFDQNIRDPEAGQLMQCFAQGWVNLARFLREGTKGR